MLAWSATLFAWVDGVTFSFLQTRAAGYPKPSRHSLRGLWMQVNMGVSLSV